MRTGTQGRSSTPPHPAGQCEEPAGAHRHKKKQYQAAAYRGAVRGEERKEQEGHQRARYSAPSLRLEGRRKGPRRGEEGGGVGAAPASLHSSFAAGASAAF